MWQSIWAGAQTFKKGNIWRVGNGLKINIWEDCWVPNSSSRKIVTSCGNRVLTWVNELIDPVSGEWDENLIREFFWPIDVDRILQIPLHQDDTEDYVAWHLTKTGIFSVRSTYYKQWEDSYDSTEPSSLSSGSAPHPIWKKLWSLKVPNKVKIFIW